MADSNSNDDASVEQKSRGGSFLTSIGDFVQDAGDFVGDAYGKVDELVDDMHKPVIINIKGIRNAGRSCHESARETTELCQLTVTKAKEMVAFGLDIKATLVDFGTNGMDASALETIKDLIDGDKMRSAMKLAGEMDDLCLQCVDKSVKMISSMDQAVDALPDIVEHQIENKVDAAAEKGAKQGDPDLPDIEPDVRELERCVIAVRDVNLFTVFDAGVKAFNGLTAKGEVCKEMFSAIKDFAEDIVQISQAIKDFAVTKMIGEIRDLAKDIWRCLRLGDLIKAFAMQVKKLVNWIINLFKIASEKLSMIWGALAHAKDVMAEVVKYVLEAMGLCDNAKEQSEKLIATSREITSHMSNMASVNSSAIGSLKDLMDGDEIREAIKLATSMDDIVLAAVQKIVVMIKKVTEAFNNLPEAITEGISDMMEAGKAEDDPEPVDVGADVEELDRQRSTIESASAFEAIQASRAGFNGVEEKVAITKVMIQQSRGFAESCNKNIEDFMGVWDIKAAMDKLIEMCRLVKLGDLLKNFAEQIRRLVKAVKAVIESVREKIKNIDFVPDKVEDAFDDAVQAAAKCCSIQ